MKVISSHLFLIVFFFRPLVWADDDIVARGEELKKSFLEIQQSAEIQDKEEMSAGEEDMNQKWLSIISYFGLIAFGANQISDVNAQKRPYNGGRGPGGGDVLLCEKSSSNRFQGIYSYDYVQTRNSLIDENSDEYAFDDSSSCFARMNQIAQRLTEVNPVMGAGLKDFIKSAPWDGGESTTPKRRWISSGEEQRPECHSFDLKDETHLVKSENCQTCQLFIRDYSRTRPQILYTYNAGLFKSLKERPTQCSYALIHEWARDFLPDSKDLYFFTSSLHSKKFFDNGELSLIPLDPATQHCFENSGHAPMDTSIIDTYFQISALVPPTQDEVEQYQKEMIKVTDNLDREIDKQLLKFKEHPPIGFNQAQVDYLIKRTQQRKVAVMSSLDGDEISHTQAYEELKLIQSALPTYEPAIDINMIFLADPMTAGEFVRTESDDDSLGNIKIIKSKRVSP